MSEVTVHRAPVTDVTDRPATNGKAAETATAKSTSGWVVFAAVILMLAGASRVLDAVWAFQYNRALPENLQGALFGTSLSTYGWIWVAVGAVLILVGLGLFGIGWFAGSKVGRWIGAAAAFIGGLSAMTWMAYYPVWSITYVAAAVVVIYALLVHGERSQAE